MNTSCKRPSRRFSSAASCAAIFFCCSCFASFHPATASFLAESSSVYMWYHSSWSTICLADFVGMSAAACTARSISIGPWRWRKERNSLWSKSSHPPVVPPWTAQYFCKKGHNPWYEPYRRLFFRRKMYKKQLAFGWLLLFKSEAYYAYYNFGLVAQRSKASADNGFYDGDPSKFKLNHGLELHRYDNADSVVWFRLSWRTIASFCRANRTVRTAR